MMKLDESQSGHTTPATQRSLVHVLRRRVEDSADKPWLIFPDCVLTYREADALSNRFANGMRKKGIRRGETLLVMLPDGPDLVMSWLACAKLGVIEVPVNTAYRGDILAHIVRDSRARTMLVSSAHVEWLKELGGALGNIERCFVRAQE
ncbi:MAG: AMP-binding protein, partial [Aestuariivirgaceae bacterium]